MGARAGGQGEFEAGGSGTVEGGVSTGMVLEFSHRLGEVQRKRQEWGVE